MVTRVRSYGVWTRKSLGVKRSLEIKQPDPQSGHYSRDLVCVTNYSELGVLDDNICSVHESAIWAAWRGQLDSGVLWDG